LNLTFGMCMGHDRSFHGIKVKVKVRVSVQNAVGRTLIFNRGQFSSFEKVFVINPELSSHLYLRLWLLLCRTSRLLWVLTCCMPAVHTSVRFAAVS